jgi:DNA-binding NarL/FixJ family response regulator
MCANSNPGAAESTASPSPSLDNILFIDKIPLLAYAFQELVRGINRAVHVRYAESYFSVLSRPVTNEPGYGLIIIGSDLDDSTVHLQVPVYELRKKFPIARIMVYSGVYDPAVIQMVENSTIDACLHTFEPVEELRSAYQHLLRGETFISPMLRTLYYDYKLMDEKIQTGRY